MLIADLIGCDCYATDEDCSMDDYNSSIAEINAMIQHSIDINDAREIAFWRGMLQKARVEKRRAKKKMIEENKYKELALI